MAQLNHTTTDETMGDFTPMPAGQYIAFVAESEVKQSSTGNTGLNLKFQVMGGDFDGRTIYNWLNIQHSNPTARQIATKELNSICEACGFPVGTTITDSNQLHGIAMIIDVKIGKDQNGNPSNEIKGYKVQAPEQAAAQPAAQPAQEPQPQAQAAGAPATPSWQQ